MKGLIDILRKAGAKPNSDLEKKICEYVKNNFVKK
jgi:hypothetical protein